MKNFFKEFKDFISKGNVFDMAVGLIIATAFNKIVSSLVNDIIMPLITWWTGAQSLSDLSIPLKYGYNENGVYGVTLSWAYGMFLQTVIDFLIIALSVFIMVKIVNRSRKKLEEIDKFVTTQTQKEVLAKRKELRKKAKEEKVSFKLLWKEYMQQMELENAEKQKQFEAEQKAKEAEERLKNPTEQDLLKDIRDLLKEQTKKG